MNAEEKKNGEDNRPCVFKNRTGRVRRYYIPYDHVFHEEESSAWLQTPTVSTYYIGRSIL